MKPITALILGGYGVFGGRLAQLLSDNSSLTLIIAGRDGDKAAEFCARHQQQATLRPLKLDRKDIASALAEHGPDVVIDASGPFQDYGSNPYQVIEACIAARVNYLDFADAADFVFGVSQLDDQARAAGVFVLSGVSSFPVLTAAVLREMTKTMEIVDVEGGIAPSPFAGVGLNVMRAVVGYAGSPVKLTRDGKQTTGTGLGESRRYTVAVPGELPLRNIHFSLVDVPDLQVLPPEHPSLQNIWMGAGPVPESLHRILNLLAKARAGLSLPSLEPFSRLFYFVLNLMKFGEHRGGMYVSASGTANGKPARRSWHLLAERDDGPFIPSMAIEGIVRKLITGQRPNAGARPATHALELADYDQLFARRTISTGFRDDLAVAPLYRKLLGDAYSRLPAQLQALHNNHDNQTWSGTAKVQGSSNILGNLLARLIGFPTKAGSMPVSVTFTPEGGGERWTRNFGGKRFSSLQIAGAGRDQHLLVERFGIIDISIALVIEDNRLLLIPRRWKLLGVPMPHFLLPTGTSYETEQDGTFCFDVTINVPVLGRLVAYRGKLRKETR